MDHFNKSENEKRTSSIKAEIDKRSRLLLYTFIGMGVLFVICILVTQYSAKGTELRKIANSSVNYRDFKIQAHRGSILSYDGKVMATTVPEHHLYMDFKSSGLKPEFFNENVEALSQELSKYYKDKSAKDYKTILEEGYKNGDRYKRISPRRVNSVEINKVLSFPILDQGRYKGARIIDTVERRDLPYGELAKRTIGHVNSLGKGSGLEISLDSILSGVDGVALHQKVSGTFWIPTPTTTDKDPINGIDVVTTIDVEAQDVAEMMLKKQVLDNNASWGSAILMEVETGEIRALANFGKDDSGRYGDIYNYGIAQNMEPGSTFKVVSLLALLEKGGMNINTLVDCGDGNEKVGYATVRDTRAWGYGIIPLGRVFEVSSNIGFARAVTERFGHNPNGFADFFESKNFHKPFDFEINGESLPVVRRTTDAGWSGRSISMMAFGYEVMMTPLRTLAIYNGIANNGVYVRPHIVKELIKDGTVIERTPIDTLCSSLCSTTNLKDIQYSMEQVVNDGTAKILRNQYYKVAGKTGTAQVSKGSKGYHYDGGRNYLATVVGYFPADKPKYSCIVTIEVFHKDGSSNPYYGGSLSGPVFRAIADKMYSKAIGWGNELQRPQQPITTQTTTAKKSSKNEKLAVVKVGSREDLMKVSSQLELNGKGNIEVAYTDSIVVKDFDAIEIGKIPNVKGMGLRDAIYAINKAGFKVKPNGTGMVVGQYPMSADSLVDNTVTLVLK
ncbi:MAG: penicillin-binding protein [Rikenellaceae bacterium]